MKISSARRAFVIWSWTLSSALLCLLLSAQARALTLQVVDQNGAPITTGYRWLVEEDNTAFVAPLVHDTSSPGVGIHKSHAPVIASGTSADPSPLALLDPAARYVVSVLPNSGYTLGAANVAVGQQDVTVRVAANTLQTAQISILVFHDNQSINGAPDLPAEPGLSGVRIDLYDTLGQLATDVFGNPLGTTYNPDGSRLAIGQGIYTEDWSPTNNTPGRLPDATKHGRVIIKNLAPGKYGVRAVPEGNVKDFAGNVFSVPATDWIQTSTIEGTPGIDAWVRAGEPPYFAEAGFFDVHAFIGFVLPQQMTKPSPTNVFGTITGQAVSVHQARPPISPGLSPGRPVPNAWVGLNDLGAADEQVYAQPAAPDGTFTIENVPPGTYLLTVWDRALDMIMDFRTVVVPPEGGFVVLGPVAYFRWFGRLEGTVFHDDNRNAFRDDGEPGIPQQAMTIRFRDGSVYQRTITDDMGFYHYEEVFPFFKWLVTEVDASRRNPTGLTTIIDNGGALAPDTKLNPQPQLGELGPIINPNTGDNLSRTSADGALTQGMIVYADQTNVIDWGKTSFDPGTNGGIAGMVFYQTTRAEDDPRYVAGDDWEPDVPGVRVNLYQVVGGLDTDGIPIETFMVNTALTDSWDASLPTGCRWLGLDLTLGDNASYVDCAEILGNWNQVRPAVYDGAYAFVSHYPSGILVDFDDVTGKVSPVLDAAGQPIPNDPDDALVGMPPGQYVVEIVPPAGYEVVKEEDKNVDFGDSFLPRTELPPPPCVGEDHPVPPELSLFPGVPGAFAGEVRPLCDRRLVDVTDEQNTAADFGIFTHVPKAGRIVGIITNDVALEFSPTSPRKGDNLAPSWMPVSFKDHLGREITRVYADEWGVFDVLLPSTYTVNVPSPTGVSPGIVQVCLNDLGDPLSPDPHYNPAYARPCFNFDVWPGKTTYADVPILPIGAMTANHGIVDCAIPVAVPEIARVDGPGGGPYVDTNNAVITIQGAGFGATRGSGSVELTTPAGVTTSLNVTGAGTSWSDTTIVARVPPPARTGQLTVVNGAGQRSVLGITLHVQSATYNPPVVRVPAGGSIQAAIDTAAPGSLVLVPPGVYPGNLIVYKPIQLQGYGARSVLLESGVFWTQEARDAWDAKLAAIIASGVVSLVDGERADFFLERGAGVMVLGSADPALELNDTTRKGRVDGFTIRGAVQGGGVFLNAFAHRFEVSNNRIESNQGSFGGGVRVGTPSIVNDAVDGYNSSFNDHVGIHNNHIKQNGAIDGGGGVALFNGTADYVVRDNYICGNFSLQYGGGIAHFGLSPNGRIEANTILFNEAFDEGGGVMLAGELPLQGGAVLSPGSGSIVLTSNLIQGNLGGDDGGGIRTLLTNGQDVAANPTQPGQWHEILIVNNMIVDNVSADAGGGISLDDSARTWIVHNTIANNDSTATGTDAFGGPCPPSVPEELCQGGVTPVGGLVSSVPQPAGIASNAHSAGLQAAFGPGFEQAYSNPVLFNDIIWHNRAFRWDATLNGGLGGLSPDPSTPFYWDIEVTGVAAHLDPQFCALTSLTGIDGFPYAPSNVAVVPPFIAPYVNVFAATSGGAALGNFVTVAFQPLTPAGNYHLSAGLPGASSSSPSSVLGPIRPEIQRDFDRDFRPVANADIGADER